MITIKILPIKHDIETLKKFYTEIITSHGIAGLDREQTHAVHKELEGLKITLPKNEKKEISKELFMKKGSSKPPVIDIVASDRRLGIVRIAGSELVEETEEAAEWIDATQVQKALFVEYGVLLSAQSLWDIRSINAVIYSEHFRRLDRVEAIPTYKMYISKVDSDVGGKEIFIDFKEIEYK